MTSQHGGTRVACWINKATRVCTHPRAWSHTHARTHAQTHARADQYVILIAFPRQQWLGERASVLRFTYIDCIVMLTVVRMLLIVNKTTRLSVLDNM